MKKIVLIVLILGVVFSSKADSWEEMSHVQAADFNRDSFFFVTYGV